MKTSLKFIHIFFTTIIAICCMGCLKDEVSLPEQKESDYNLVYMPQAVNPPAISSLLFKTETQFLVYGANYGGTSYPESDIQVSFSVQADSVAAFNEKNRTSYPMMPAGSYTLSDAAAIIPKGKLASQPLKISVKTEGALELFKEYLLPVTLSLNSGTNVKMNQNLSTAYYLVSASLPNFDKSAWRIVSFSSEEVSGEGPNNGRAAQAIDNSINTYWHTRYSDGFADPPHYLVIDMNETKAVHGVNLVARQNEDRGRPMDIAIQTSSNGTDWTSSYNFTMLSTNSAQRFILPEFKDARYLKLIISRMYDNASHTHLAEISAF